MLLYKKDIVTANPMFVYKGEAVNVGQGDLALLQTCIQLVAKHRKILYYLMEIFS